MKKITIPLVILGGAVALAYFFVSEEEITSPSAPQQRVVAADRVVSVSPRFQQDSEECLANRAQPQQLPQKSLNQFVDAVDKSVSENFSDPIGILDRQDGTDPVSSVALFKIIRNCYPLTNFYPTSSESPDKLATPIHSSCPRLKMNLVSSPLKLIEQAAYHGSPEAKLLFAMNSFTFIQSLKRQNTGESMREALDMIEKSKKYGEEAAKAGVAEASAFMAHSYNSSFFGPRNPALAYEHSLRIKHRDAYSSIKSEVEKFSLEIPAQEKNKIELKVFGCKKSGHQDHLNNPFDMEN